MVQYSLKDWYLYADDNSILLPLPFSNTFEKGPYVNCKLAGYLQCNYDDPDHKDKRTQQQNDRGCELIILEDLSFVSFDILISMSFISLSFISKSTVKLIFSINKF